MDKIEKAKNVLKKYGQDHIIVDTERLADEVLKIDFEQLQDLYDCAINRNKICNIEKLEPVKAINPAKISKEQIEEYKNIGKSKIEAGKFAIAIMAGGQGSRLRT